MKKDNQQSQHHIAKAWMLAPLFALHMASAQAEQYQVVTSQSVERSADSQPVNTRTDFSYGERVHAFVTISDLNQQKLPTQVQAQWYMCDQLVGTKDFNSSTMKTHGADGKHHVWFWAESKELGVGDGSVRISAQGKEVARVNFNIADASNQRGNCKQADEVISLPTDILFKYNGASTQQMYTSGVTEVAQLAKKLKNEYRQINRIHVLGYADHMGPASYNQRLSQTRANTVAQIIAQRGGIARNKIVAKGKGELNSPEGCAQQRGQALIECLAPNRKVVIQVFGTK